jgi:hypothetical protein
MWLLRLSCWKSIRTLLWGTNDKTTYTIGSENMQWFRSSKRKGIDGGWYVLATNDNDEQESFVIEDELCRQIADTPQNGDIENNQKGSRRRGGRVIAVKHSFTC